LNPFGTAGQPHLKKLLDGIQTIAVIGCSSNPYRTSYHIAEYLLQAGLTMIPVNPNEREVLGQKAVASLDDIPSDTRIDLVNIFRNKAYTDSVVQEIIRWSDERAQKPVIWTQLDVSTPGAKELALDQGFEYVENRCLMVEHRRMTL
jgi:uncharacterized protein